MKTRTKIVLPIIGVVIVLAALAFLLKGTGLLLPPRYDASAPTSAKFARLSRWLPAGTDFDVTIDVPRALTNPALSERLGEITARNNGVAAALISGLLTHQNAVGLITIAGTLGDRTTPPRAIVLAQGNFDEKVILPSIRTAMAAGHAGLASEDLGWTTLFSEADVRDPFGFIVLNREHLAVGSADALRTLFAKKPEPRSEFARSSDAVLFGHVTVGDRLKEIMPSTVVIPASADFMSLDGTTVRAWFPTAGAQEAQALQLFLEGVRALILLQQEENPSLAPILKAIGITVDGNGVAVESPLPLLLDLWSNVIKPDVATSDQEGNQATSPNVEKPAVR